MTTIPDAHPAGWRLSPGVRWLDRTTLAGGVPYRVIRLTTRGAALIRSTMNPAPSQAGPTQRQPAEVELMSRLETAGLLCSPAPAAADYSGVTVVIPARSAVEPLEELLRRLPNGIPVVIVDDGSPVPLAGLTAARPNVEVLSHEASRGPAAARNAGAAVVRTPWIAFLDADTLPDPDWIGALMGHLRAGDGVDSPLGAPVVLAAPRICSVPGTGTAAWFEQRVCSLDLGAAPSDVGVGRPVSYVPSAAMLVRTDIFREVGGFEEAMNVGEDVDLVWRIAQLGRVRYLPDVRVGHRPRGNLLAALNRRRFYGTSAADLAARHPGSLRHIDVSVWSLGPWLLGVAVHPLLGVAAAAGTAAIAPWGMPDVSPRHARQLAARGHLQAAAAIGRWLVRPMLPLTVVLGIIFPRLGRRLLLAVAAGIGYHVVADVHAAKAGAATNGGAIAAAAGTLVARMLDDAAYSTGVWQGVLARRTPEPVLPKISDLPTWTRLRRPTGGSSDRQSTGG